jgi:hypothetical protein
MNAFLAGKAAGFTKGSRHTPGRHLQSISGECRMRLALRRCDLRKK